MKRIIHTTEARSAKIAEPLTFAVAPDIHSGQYADVLEAMLGCDAVLLPGDLMDRHRRNNSRAAEFLRTVPEIVPVFLSPGNHEALYPRQDELAGMLRNSAVRLLDNTDEEFRGIRIGGLSSREENDADTGFLDRFEAEDGFRLLLCHQPEIYRDYVSGRDIDLTLCGHAHGGQIQIRGRGIYSPGQGLFPRLTGGWYDDRRMLLSRGMTNASKPPVPRFGNPCELIILRLLPEEEKEQC